MIYYNTDFYREKFSNELLTTDEAMHAVMEKTTWGAHALYFNIYDNSSKLIFHPSYNMNLFTINQGISSHWKKEFYILEDREYVDNFSYIDKARHAQLLLELIKGLCLVNLKIIDFEEQKLHDLAPNQLKARIINKDDTYERLIRNIYLNNSRIAIPSGFKNTLSWDKAIKHFARIIQNQALTLYIETTGTMSELTICEDTITLLSLDPLRHKLVDGIIKRDTAFYVKLFLGICEEYPILEFKTTFEDCY